MFTLLGISGGAGGTGSANNACGAGFFAGATFTMFGNASLGTNPGACCIDGLDAPDSEGDSSLLLRVLEYLCFLTLLLRRTRDLPELDEELDGDLCFLL